jgi:hypothetical protein
LYQSGMVSGISVSFLLGLKAPAWAMTKVGPLKWTATGMLGLDVYGAGKATGNLVGSYLDNGKWEREDAWNLLAYVPFVGAIQGVNKFFTATKASKGDNLVSSSTSNVVTRTGNCFVAGTEVLTAEGMKKIEDIQVGDLVLADDPNTVGEIEYKEVLNTFIRQTDKLVDLYIDGEVISTTGEHPFWTPDKGWVEAKDLVVGSLVQTSDGRVVDVDGVESRVGEFTVYNFSVEGFHSYFVSELGVLVHNANCEILVNKSSFEQARNYALNLIGDIDPSNRVPVIGKFGQQQGKIVGFTTKVDGQFKRFRVDFDPVKGPHINTEVGTGDSRIKYAVQFPGTEADVMNFINQMYN